MESTRNLDSIYYTILERLSTLQSTIRSLQDLSDDTKELRSSFDADAEEVETSISEQIKSFGGFKKQRQYIDSMQTRIRQSKEKTDKLSERLDVARGKLMVLENQESEVQASINCKSERCACRMNDD